MNKESSRIVALYIVLFGLFALLLAANYFHERIDVYTGRALSSYFVPITSFVIILFIAIKLLRRERDLNLLKYQFLTIATHKFRTPLTGIKWASSMLKKDTTSHEEQDDLLKEIDTSVERLLEVVDLLVGLAKFDTRLSYVFEATSLRETLDITLDKYAQRTREKNIKFSITAAQNLPLVVMDKKKIQFVIDMLIENALKYTPAGGTIAVNFSLHKNKLLIKVTDSGIGISQSDLHRLFEKFYRADNARSVDTEGMGLGLYIAKTIVVAHQGTMWAESAGQNKGSSFFIALPIKSY